MMIAEATIMATTFGFAAGDIAGDVNDSVSIFNKTLAGGLGMAPGSKAGRLPTISIARGSAIRPGSALPEGTGKDTVLALWRDFHLVYAAANRLSRNDPIAAKWLDRGSFIS
jgi:hypothetical protein